MTLATVADVDTNWFKGALADKRISQRRLAQTLGLDPAAVSLMFNGKRKMSAAEAAAIAKVLGVGVDDVMRHAGVVVPTGAHAAPPPKSIGMMGVVKSTNGDDFIDIPIPLSNGFIALIKIPKSFSKMDADKINAVINAFAMPE